MDAFENYMSARRIPKGMPNPLETTHVGMDPRGKWHIPDRDAKGKFLDMYAEAVDQGRHLSVLERTLETAPLLVDLDFKVEGTNKNCDRGPTQDEIIKFVAKYFEVVRVWLDIGESELAWVLTRDGSHGVHIMVPHVVCKWYVQQGIREAMLPHMPDIFQFEVTDWAVAYDLGVLRPTTCNWLLYGSSKGPGKSVYKPRYMVSGEGVYHAVNEEDGTTLDYVKLFSIRNKGHIMNTHLIEGPPEEEPRTLRSTQPNGTSGVSKDLEGEDVERLIDMVDPKLADDRMEWLKMGFALGDAFKEDLDEGRRLFHVFSQKSVKYVEQECDDKWEVEFSKSARSEGCNLGTIKNWAKAHSPDAYTEYKKAVAASKRAAQRKQKHEESGVTIVPYGKVVGSTMAAEKFLEVCGDEVVYDEDNVNVYIEGMWEFDEHVVGNKVYRVKDSLVFGQENDKGGVRLIDYGGCQTKKKAMIEAVKDIRALDDRGFFAKKGDTGFAKILFKDGFYDMETREFTEGFDKEVMFRGRIERDFPRRRDSVLEDKIAKLLFSDSFMPSAEEQEAGRFLKTALARGLAGEYRAKKFYVCVGMGNAGRGLITEAFTQAFDGFVGTFNPNEMANRDMHSSDEAVMNGYLVDFAHKRIVFGNEADPCRTLNGTAIRSAVSGGDTIYARKQHGRQAPLVVRATLFMMMNDMPVIKPYDDAVDNRIDMLWFKRRFVDQPDPAKPWEAQMDATLKDAMRQDAWKDALFWVMVDAYYDFITKLGGKNPAPPVCVDAKAKWAEESSGPVGMLKKDYEFTLDLENDYAAVTEIAAFFKDRKLGMSSRKYGELLRMEGLVYDPNRKGTVNGNQVHVWRGLKLRDGCVTTYGGV